MEAQRIPADIDYSKLTGLRLEAKEKLAAVRPENLGQAARISGQPGGCGSVAHSIGEPMIDTEKLSRLLEERNIAVDGYAAQRLDLYAQRLVAWNEK